jgi:hypothetical protein
MNVDFKFWAKLIEFCPEIFKYVQEDKSFELRANEYILNNSDLWSLGSFLTVISKNDASKLLVNTEKNFVKRSIARLEDGKEDWGLFPILDLISTDSKKELYNTLKPSMMNVKFNNSKVLAGTLYEFIVLFSKIIDNDFVDFIYENMISNTIQKNNESLFYGGALLKMKLKAKYINEKIFKSLEKTPNLITLINLIDKEATDRSELLEIIKILLAKQVENNKKENIQFVEKYLHTLSND